MPKVPVSAGSSGWSMQFPEQRPAVDRASLQAQPIKKRFIRAASARAVLFLPPFPFPFRQFGMQEVRYFFNRFPFYPVAVPGPLRTSHPEFPGNPFREGQLTEFPDLLSTGYPDRLDPVGI